MKSGFFLACAFLASATIPATQAIAGDMFPVHEGAVKMSKGSQNSLSVVIPKGDLKQVDKDWKALLKEHNGRVKAGKGETFGDNARFDQMSDNTVDVYSILHETKDGIELTAFFDLGGAYLASSTHPEKYKVAENVLYQFAVKESRGVAEREIMDQEKALDKLSLSRDDLETEFKDLTKRVEKDKDVIAKAQADIKDLEAQIVKNRQALEVKAAEVTAQQQKIAGMKTAAEAIK